jgi:hypothetical protein
MHDTKPLHDCSRERLLIVSQPILFCDYDIQYNACAMTTAK